jgi:hypothetical protein
MLIYSFNYSLNYILKQLKQLNTRVGWSSIFVQDL